MECQNQDKDVAIACTGVTGQPLLQISITCRDRGDACRYAYELRIPYRLRKAIVTFSYSDSESPTCSHCGYFTRDTTQDVPKLNCPVCGREVLDVTSSVLRMSISAVLIALIPESVALECCVVPFGEDSTGLVVLTDLRQTIDTNKIEKLRFILNRRITCLHADRAAIMRAIERDYSKSR